MKENWVPKYFCVDTRAAKLVMRLPDESRLEFYDGLVSAFLRKVDEAEIPEPSDTFTGDILRQAIETMTDCFDVYKKRAFANLSGGKKSSDNQSQGNGNPLGIQCPALDRQEISSGKEISTQDIQIIKSRLKAEGYSDDEIQYGINRTISRPDVKDFFSYCRKTMDEARKKPQFKTVPAQQYSQHDYEGEQEAALQRMIEKVRKEGMLA